MSFRSDPIDAGVKVLGVGLVLLCIAAPGLVVQVGHDLARGFFSLIDKLL